MNRQSNGTPATIEPTTANDAPVDDIAADDTPDRGPQWRPHTYYLANPGGGGRKHSEAIQVVAEGRIRERSGYTIQMTLRLPVDDNGDPVQAHVDAELHKLKAGVRDRIADTQEFRNIKNTLEKIHQVDAQRQQLSAMLERLEEDKAAIVDGSSSGAEMTKQAGDIAAKEAEIKAELVGADALLDQLDGRREQQLKALEKTARSIWTSGVQSVLAEWEKARFDLGGLCAGGEVNVQEILERLCRLGMIEWNWRTLGNQADIEVKPILDSLIPEAPIISRPSPVGVQIPGLDGEAAVTFLPFAARDQVDREPVKVFPSRRSSDGVVSPPSLPPAG